jgi:hypothetical protein
LGRICRGIIHDAGVTEARIQHAQITSEKTAAPAAIKMSPPNPAGLWSVIVNRVAPAETDIAMLLSP